MLAPEFKSEAPPDHRLIDNTCVSSTLRARSLPPRNDVAKVGHLAVPLESGNDGINYLVDFPTQMSVTPET